MTIAAGIQLGPYEILAPLGAGGMGEVWRARDKRLNREVAIKVLPASFANDADRLRRFEQEALATSALNHPNILTIYDIGAASIETGGAPYIVAELLEGEELRAKLSDGAITPRKAVEYAQQIATGLAAAHEKGIVHRDLKPENLFVTKDDRVKILDFGLAKLRQRNVSVSSEVATQKQLTDPGVILGTAGYMSPEQVRGQDADHRSDIFSFGVILYEMCCGSRAFQRDTVAESMTAILKEEPPEITETNSKVPAQLGRIVRRCLEKKPERRFHSAHDLGFALEALSAPSGSNVSAATSVVTGAEINAANAVAAHRTKRERVAWTAGSVLFGVVIAAGLMLAIAYFFQRAPGPPAVIRFTIPLPAKLVIGDLLALSPDGKQLAFSGTDETGKTLLWIRALDTLTPQPLPDTEGARFPFWSPDGRSLGFLADSKLKRIEIAGGPAQTLADASLEPRGATWGSDGTILFTPGPATPIYKVSASGGTAAPLTQLDQSRNETSHRWPYLLPDGRHFIYFARGPKRENQALFLASVDSKDRKLLLNVESNVAYMPPDTSSRQPGLLLFVRDRTLMARPFDADKLELSGEPYAIAKDVVHYGEIGPTALGMFSISTTGVLCYQTGNRSVSQLAWFDRSGKQLGKVGPAGPYNEPALSPDGQRVAVNNNSLADQGDIWILEFARSTFTRLTLTLDPARDLNPSWSPDGSHIVWLSNRSGAYQIYKKLSSGVGQEELLLKGEVPIPPTAWSADGRFILYTLVDPKKTYFSGEVWVLPMEGDRKPYPFSQTPFDASLARFSPDGRWIAYQSNESGSTEVYVQTFPASGGKWQVSTSGGEIPHWRSDGKEMFYLSTDGKLMAVELKPGSAFEPGIPRALFDLTAVQAILNENYAVTADGQRFLFVSQGEGTAPSSLTVVVNWTAGLKR